MKPAHTCVVVLCLGAAVGADSLRLEKSSVLRSTPLLVFCASCFRAGVFLYFLPKGGVCSLKGVGNIWGPCWSPDLSQHCLDTGCVQNMALEIMWIVHSSTHQYTHTKYQRIWDTINFISLKKSWHLEFHPNLQAIYKPAHLQPLFPTAGFL